MKKNIYILLLLSISCLAFTCSGDEDCESYQFELPVSVTPVDTISLGDTIWLESHITRDLINLKNNKLVTLDTSFQFGSFLAIKKISVAPFIDAGSKVKISDVIGSSKVHPISYTINYAIDYRKQGNQLDMILGLTMQDTGTFTLALWYPDYSTHHDYSCQNIYNRTKMLYSMNNKAENNHNMYISSPDTIFKETTKEIYDENGHYTFVVK